MIAKSKTYYGLLDSNKYNLVILGLAVTADKTTHSCRAVIVHLTLHPHLPMSTSYEGFDAYNIWQFFLIAAGADASSSLGPWFRSVSLVQPSVTSLFASSSPC